MNVVTKKPEDTFTAEAYSRFSAYGAGKYGASGGFDVTGPIAGTDFSYSYIHEDYSVPFDRGTDLRSGDRQGDQCQPPPAP